MAWIFFSHCANFESMVLQKIRQAAGQKNFAKNHKGTFLGALQCLQGSTAMEMIVCEHHKHIKTGWYRYGRHLTYCCSSMFKDFRWAIEWVVTLTQIKWPKGPWLCLFCPQPYIEQALQIEDLQSFKKQYHTYVITYNMYDYMYILMYYIYVHTNVYYIYVCKLYTYQ